MKPALEAPPPSLHLYTLIEACYDHDNLYNFYSLICNVHCQSLFEITFLLDIKFDHHASELN